MEIDDTEYNRIRNEAEAFYRSIGNVKCPYFGGEAVSFTIDGFLHLVSKNEYRVRTRAEQRQRFLLLRQAVLVLKRTTTLQEYDERYVMVRQKQGHGWHKKVKLVRYFAFVAIVDDAKFRVIVRQIDGASKQFHSVFPCWKNVSDGKGGYKRIFSIGNLETD